MSRQGSRKLSSGKLSVSASAKRHTDATDATEGLDDVESRGSLRLSSQRRNSVRFAEKNQVIEIDAVGTTPMLRSSRSSGLITKATSSARSVLSDLSRLHQDMEPIEQFYSLRADARMTHGLQYWDARSWQEHMLQDTQSAYALVADLLGTAMASSASEDNFASASRAIHIRLTEPMRLSEWEKVLTFQNSVFNNEGKSETAASLHYMSPTLLSTYMFDQEYPLGVEQSVLRDRHAFAIQHSGQRSTAHRKNIIHTIMVYAMVLGGFLSLVTLIFWSLADGPWTLTDTIQNQTENNFMDNVIARGQARGYTRSALSRLLAVVPSHPVPTAHHTRTRAPGGSHLSWLR